MLLVDMMALQLFCVALALILFTTGQTAFSGYEISQVQYVAVVCDDLSNALSLSAL